MEQKIVPWGKETVWADTPHYTAKFLHINAGHRLSLQYYLYKDETICLQSGLLEFSANRIHLTNPSAFQLRKLFDCAFRKFRFRN